MAEIMNTATEKKMTGSLMSILFQRKTIAESSVTGKGKEELPALDPVKVQLIICKFIIIDINLLTGGQLVHVYVKGL